MLKKLFVQPEKHVTQAERCSRMNVGTQNQAKSYILKKDDDALDAKELGLSVEQVNGLRKMGLDSCSRLAAAIPHARTAFGKLLGMSGRELHGFTGRLDDLLGSTVLAELDRELIECSLGLILEEPEEPLLGETGGEAETQAGASGETPEYQTSTARQAGYDFVVDMPNIRRQGARQTCTSHAIVRCIEFLELEMERANGNSAVDAATKDLSEQFMYWHQKDIDGHPRVHNSTLTAAVQVVTGKGTCLETDWPYRPDLFKHPADPSERGPRPDPDGALELDRKALEHKACERLSVARIPYDDTNLVMRLLTNRIPVAYGIQVFASWQKNQRTWQDGKLFLPPETEEKVGGHAITLVGFGVDPDVAGGGYFIFDNSWDVNWGRDNVFGPGRGILPFEYATTYGNRAAYVMLPGLDR